MPLSFIRVLLGRPVPNKDAATEKIGVLQGLAAMGLDALASVAYGPEAMLAVLVAAGAAGLAVENKITFAIVLLLITIYFSYRQTIAAYPNSGGSYVVAKTNLGPFAGTVSAAALMIDYLLNVAVGISAGVGALTSAVPELHSQMLLLCLVILAVLTLANLRGIRESSTVLAIPTYTYIASIGAMLIMALGQTWLTGGRPVPVIPPPPIPPGTEAVGIWLVLRAFASGCTAMTGVEAVSNGVSAFKEPRVRTAHRTLTVMVVTLAIFVLGVAEATRSYGIMAMDQSRSDYQSVLSQLAAAVSGRGWFYYVTLGSVLAVLCISANTSFVDFPRLCQAVAADGYLPAPFAIPGRRLVYSVGIAFLAIGACVLLVAFGGITDSLIPLFAIGAFMSFTFSQAGMAVHWRRALRSSNKQTDAAERRRVWVRLLINAGGALATGVALIVITISKFAEGAWIVLIIIPATLALLRACKRYNVELDRRLLRGSHRRIDVQDHTPPVAIVPIRRWDVLARKAVEYALRVSPDVTGLHITKLGGPSEKDDIKRLHRDWSTFVQEPAREVGLKPPELEVVLSEYRSVVSPLLRAIQQIDERDPKRLVLVVLPELIEGRWWGYVLHTHQERRLRAKLLRYGGPRISVASVPWQLEPLTPQQGVEEEET
jgi:amino acid transporter